jgi:hypothetical protein
MALSVYWEPSPLPLAGDEGSGTLGELVQGGGFFAVTFGQTPDLRAAERPTGTLGPGYTVTYVVPGPNGESDRLRQDVYPFAEPAPVTYMAPGQEFFGTERTVGGWYVGADSLRDALLAAGLPESPPAGPDGDGFPWPVAGALSALAAALAAVLGAAVLARRRGTAPA